MVSNIEVKFEKWKEKLLDSGKRNPLINFRVLVCLLYA